VHVCYGKNCTPNGAVAVYAAFEQAIRAAGLSDEVELIATSCRSRCELGPSVNVYPGPTTYGLMDAERVRAVVARHLAAGGSPVAEFVVTEEDVQRAKGL
jgi:(2Fe-2S) ferredoxin